MVLCLGGLSPPKPPVATGLSALHLNVGNKRAEDCGKIAENTNKCLMSDTICCTAINVSAG